MQEVPEDDLGDLLEGRNRLAAVADDLRGRVGGAEDPSGTMPSEMGVLQAPSSVDDPEGVISVDAFLYDEEQEERLVEEGVLPRARCNRCGSKDTTMLGEEDNDIHITCTHAQWGGWGDIIRLTFKPSRGHPI